MRIKGLKICNFKVFDEKFDKIDDISKASLVLMNGPNGYGKTTIFDAIELALTGEIKRINTYNDELGVKKNEAYKSMILVADETKDAYVKLILENSENVIELQRLYSGSNQSKKGGSVVFNPTKFFEKLKCKLVIDGQNVEDIDTTLTELKLNNIGDFYDKCCFLSQDEHLIFLKEANKDKANGLNFLFELPIERKKELDKLNAILQQLRNQKKTKSVGYINQLEKSEEELKSEISKLENDIGKINMSVENTISYQRIFPKKEIDWDRETVSLSGKSFDKGLIEIKNLIFFSEHQEECINYLWNKPYKDMQKPFSGIDSISFDDNPLEFTYRYYSLINNEKQIETNYNKQKNYNKLKDYIEKRQLDKISWEFLREEKLFNEDTIESIKNKLQQISVVKETQNSISSVITKIIETRTSFIGYIDDAMKKEIINGKACPLCGTPYSQKEELVKSIEEETKKLKSLCDQSSQQISNMLDELYKNYFNSLLANLLKKNDSISDSIYRRLQQVKVKKPDVEKIRELLQKININIPILYQEDHSLVEKGYNDLVKVINSKLRAISENIELELVSKEFYRIFEFYYEKNNELFLNVKCKMLHLKKNYIEHSFFNSSMKELNEKKTMLRTMDKRLRKLKEIYNEICEYQNAINDGIREYKKKIIGDIEPLLYIYTAKILQQKFNGKSIYISTDDECNSIKFVNSENDDQDILYSMSSGQLAAVSISFLLCMNQVYCGKEFPILLIDDPIQTIDDVNMVGLVDILRYEFEDRQIFMSTHEQKFEWYLRYKYEKTDGTIKLFNMKNILLQNDIQ